MSNPAFQFDHIHIISKDPEASAKWYVEMLGATIAANTTARGAPQIFVDLGGMTILIRRRRQVEPRSLSGPSGHTRTFPAITRGGTDHSGFCFQGDLEAFCAELRPKRDRYVGPRWREHRTNAVLLQ